MFEFLGQFDRLAASVGGVIVGAFGCWLVQQYQARRQHKQARHESAARHQSPTPAIQAAALATASSWFEPERILIEIRDLFEQFGKENLPAPAALKAHHGQQAVQLLQKWIAAQKNGARSALHDDPDARLKQRAAEDELVLQWLRETPGSTAAPRRAAHPESASPEVAHPELALTQIASELLPFNPIAVRLIGKRAEPEMLATVERIEKLLASVDPPESLGTMPAAEETAAPIRDPQGRYHVQLDDPQRRRSDQPIIYDALLRRCLGDDDFAWRMLHKFPSRCRAELESLATEIRRRAWTAATRRITQLRGMATNLAADNLRDALANLEHVCRQQSATRADQLLEGVYGEYQQVLDFLTRAGGEQPVEHSTEENQPVSRWPVALLAAADDQAPHIQELNTPARVS